MPVAIYLDAVWCQAAARNLREKPAAGQTARGIDVVDQHMVRFGIGDVESLFIGRKGKAVRRAIIGNGCDIAAVRRHAIDSGEIEFGIFGDPESRIKPVRRIGEVDITVRLDDHVVRTVEATALVVGRDGRRAAVLFDARHAPSGVFADDQAPLPVSRQSVRLSARRAENGHAGVRPPLMDDVCGDVAEVKAAIAGVPYRTFGEEEA